MFKKVGACKGLRAFLDQKNKFVFFYRAFYDCESAEAIQKRYCLRSACCELLLSPFANHSIISTLGLLSPTCMFPSSVGY